jgi:DNA-binding NarL/FixJ family response regulator
MEQTRILLVDDHALVRAGIRVLLQQLPGVGPVTEAGDGRAALEMISPAISKHLVRWTLGGSLPAEGALGQLTERQREILQLFAEGKGTKEVAYILGISAKTVETHRAQLMERLGIYDVPGLVRFAIRNGLVSAES